MRVMPSTRHRWLTSWNAPPGIRCSAGTFKLQIPRRILILGGTISKTSDDEGDLSNDAAQSLPSLSVRDCINGIHAEQDAEIVAIEYRLRESNVKPMVAQLREIEATTPPDDSDTRGE